MGRQTRQARRAKGLRTRPDLAEMIPVEFPRLSSRLAEWTEHLRSLPLEAPEWEEVPVFAASMMHLHAEKLTERTVALEQALEELTGAITRRFRIELRYLEVDLSTWPRDAADRPWVVPQALELAQELQTSLEHYSEVHPQAPTQSQERQRAPLRAEREQSITAALERWQDLMNQPSGLPLDMPPADSVDQHSVVSMTEYAALQEKANKWEQKYQKAQSALDKRTEERDQARAQVGYLRSLDSKPGRKPEGAASSDNAIATEPGATTVELGQIGSVREAISASEADFPDTLAIALNSASNEGTPFQRPNEVYAALEWLATEYCDIRLNPPGTDPEFEKRLKVRCPGWFYSPKQSDTSKNMFKAEYETTLDSRTYKLDQHIGRGTRGDPQYMIRIAFDWDDERQQVIVGYIGPHQRTQAS